VGDVHIIKAVTKKKEKQTFPDKQNLTAGHEETLTKGNSKGRKKLSTDGGSEMTKGMRIKEEFSGLVSKTFCRVGGTVITHPLLPEECFLLP